MKEEETNNKKPQTCSWSLVSHRTAAPKPEDTFASIFSLKLIFITSTLSVEMCHRSQQGLSNFWILCYQCVTWSLMHDGNHGKNENSRSHCLVSTYYVLHTMLSTPFTHFRNKWWAL